MAPSFGMRNVRLTLAYDGADFCGWQFQPQQRTVQATLEAAIKQVTGAWSRVCASSRTDAGVHALGQVVSFHTATRLDNDTLRRALNAVLPFDVSVKNVRDAAPDFHATRDSVRKRYRYVMQDGRIRDPIGRRYAWFIPHELTSLPCKHRQFTCWENTISQPMRRPVPSGKARCVLSMI